MRGWLLPFAALHATLYLLPIFRHVLRERMQLRMDERFAMWLAQATQQLSDALMHTRQHRQQASCIMAPCGPAGLLPYVQRVAQTHAASRARKSGGVHPNHRQNCGD